LNKRVVLVAVLSAFLVSTIFATRNLEQVTTSASTYVWPRDFDGQTLQQAINNITVKAGDTIMVQAGSYQENLVINKSLTIVGAGYFGGSTTFYGGGSGTVVRITASNATFEYFTIMNGYGGIEIDSSNNFLSNNIIENNANFGIWISIGTSGVSANDKLRSNSLINNGFNFVMEGSVIQDIDTSNTVNGKPIYYLVNNASVTIRDNVGYVAVVNSRNITVENMDLEHNGQGVLVANSTQVTLKNLKLKNNDVGVFFSGTSASVIQNVTAQNNAGILGYGICLSGSSNNNIIGNTIYHNLNGIFLQGSSSNAIIANNITSNTQSVTSGGVTLWPGSKNNLIIRNNISLNQVGIILNSANNNEFYQNNIVKNILQNSSSDSLNRWDNGAEGNYWSDYVANGGKDLNSDGIGDTLLPWHGDYCPLMEQWNPIKKFYAEVAFDNGTVKQVIKTGTLDWSITTQSNSTRAGFKFNWTLMEMSFNITSGTPESCNMTIPRILLDGVSFTINGKPASVDLKVNGYYSSFYFTYTPGTYNIKITGTRVGFGPGDINGDGTVDVLDLILVAKYLGTTPYNG
jgi:parallel beta-helix repeat protein